MLRCRDLPCFIGRRPRVSETRQGFCRSRCAGSFKDIKIISFDCQNASPAHVKCLFCDKTGRKRCSFWLSILICWVLRSRTGCSSWPRSLQSLFFLHGGLAAGAERRAPRPEIFL